jgi:hypothetical protein
MEYGDCHHHRRHHRYQHHHHHLVIRELGHLLLFAALFAIKKLSL